MKEIIPEHLRELITRNNNATIERCAQVAEQTKENTLPGTRSIQDKIAAAIRKLKDAPDPNIIHPGSDHPGPFPEELP